MRNTGMVTSKAKIRTPLMARESLRVGMPDCSAMRKPLSTEGMMASRRSKVRTVSTKAATVRLAGPRAAVPPKSSM